MSCISVWATRPIEPTTPPNDGNCGIAASHFDIIDALSICQFSSSVRPFLWVQIVLENFHCTDYKIILFGCCAISSSTLFFRRLRLLFFVGANEFATRKTENINKCGSKIANMVLRERGLMSVSVCCGQIRVVRTLILVTQTE